MAVFGHVRVDVILRFAVEHVVRPQGRWNNVKLATTNIKFRDAPVEAIGNTDTIVDDNLSFVDTTQEPRCIQTERSMVYLVSVIAWRPVHVQSTFCEGPRSADGRPLVGFYWYGRFNYRDTCKLYITF